MVNWRSSGKATAYVNYTKLVFLAKQQKILLSSFYMSFNFIPFFLSSSCRSLSGTHQETRKKLFSNRYGWSEVLIDQAKRFFLSPIRQFEQFFSSLRWQRFIFLFSLVVMNFTWKFIKNRAINLARNQVKRTSVCGRKVELNAHKTGWRTTRWRFTTPLLRMESPDGDHCRSNFNWIGQFLWHFKSVENLNLTCHVV